MLKSMVLILLGLSLMLPSGVARGQALYYHARALKKDWDWSSLKQADKGLYYFTRAMKKDWDWVALKRTSKKLYYLARALKKDWDWSSLKRMRGSFP
ncbi:hypothetical protein KJ865_13475 [Myxococcota bacterium]|nr:hypothetical protein [Myxococcota bacterium]